MKLNELRELVAKGESNTLEFKRSTGQLNSAGKSLCGFLNGSGGQVLIGVQPDGKIIGQQVSDSTLRDIAAMLDRFEPPPPITVVRVPVDASNEVLILSANLTAENLPFIYDGRPYQRVESSKSVMPQERYHQLLLERLHSTHRWDNTPAEGITLEDLDKEEILRLVRIGIDAGRLPESTRMDAEEILDRLGLQREGRLLNAAVVLFSNHFIPNYPQCQLRMARFKGTDKTEFLDQQQLEGHAFQLLDAAMLFLRRHLPVAGRILPSLIEREDEPLFPLIALREALVNAFCHRDYTLPGGSVSLAIYDDRLEIWSDGTLPFGLSTKDLKQNHPSRPRNTLIADVFYKRGLVERWGRGTQKIVELCVQAGHPEPEFLEEAGAVAVQFLPSGYVPPLRVPHELTERQREILQVLASAPQMAFHEIREALQDPPADRTIRDDFQHLKRLGLVQSTGHGRGARWSLV